MSETMTPRTDAVENSDWAFRKQAAFQAMTNLARQLERELTAAQAALNAARADVKELSMELEALVLSCRHSPGHFIGVKAPTKQRLENSIATLARVISRHTAAAPRGEGEKS